MLEDVPAEWSPPTPLTVLGEDVAGPRTPWPKGLPKPPPPTSRDTSKREIERTERKKRRKRGSTRKDEFAAVLYNAFARASLASDENLPRRDISNLVPPTAWQIDRQEVVNFRITSCYDARESYLLSCRFGYPESPIPLN